MESERLAQLKDAIFNDAPRLRSPADDEPLPKTLLSVVESRCAEAGARLPLKITDRQGHNSYRFDDASGREIIYVELVDGRWNVAIERERGPQVRYGKGGRPMRRYVGDGYTYHDDFPRRFEAPSEGPILTCPRCGS